MLPEPRRASLVLAFLAVVPAIADADAYRDARADLVSAWEAQDYASMRNAAQRGLAARPGYAAAVFNLALAEALAGDASAALAALETLLAQKAASSLPPPAPVIIPNPGRTHHTSGCQPRLEGGGIEA